MKESFLHYVWRYRHYRSRALKTFCGDSIVVLQSGMPNHNAGPDFLCGQLRIGDQLWAGNIEIHLKSSDWYAHNHEKDPAYQNVILHVVWEHDMEVFRSDDTSIPVLCLSDYVDQNVYQNYQALQQASDRWIPCDGMAKKLPQTTYLSWLERLYVERLESKTNQLDTLLRLTHNDWEAVLFQLLAKAMGLKVNGDSFLSIAKSIPFAVVRKAAHEEGVLEALFLGQAGLLNQDFSEPYAKQLKGVYGYWKKKYRLSVESVVPAQFFRLRPPNFPTIRLSQLAHLYQSNTQLFHQLTSVKSVKELRDLLSAEVSPFWQNHYSFDKHHPKRRKMFTQSFIDLLLINAVIPLQYNYNNYLGQKENEFLLDWARAISPEKNNILKKFQHLGLDSKNALETQALLQLKTHYCDLKKCSQCAIGHQLLTT